MPVLGLPSSPQMKHIESLNFFKLSGVFMYHILVISSLR